MKVTVSVPVDAEMTNAQLADAIMAVVVERLHNIDDGGCDWGTDPLGCTYIADQRWQVSATQDIACLVDAANILRYGERLVINDATGGIVPMSKLGA